MSDPRKPPPYPFGQSATSSSGPGAFGQALPDSKKDQSNPLKPSVSAAATPSIFRSTSGAALFGQNKSTTQAPSLFGSGTTSGGNTFGSNGMTSSFNFGPVSTKDSPAESLGGLGQTSSGGPSASNAPSALSSFSTPNKGSEPLTFGQDKTTSLFGGTNNMGSSSIFGKPNTNVNSSTQAQTSTPTSKPGSIFPFASTTPAGPPPSDARAGGNPGFMLNMNKPLGQTPNPFPSKATTQSTAQGIGALTAPSSQSQPSTDIFGKPLNPPTSNGSTSETANTSASVQPSQNTTSNFLSGAPQAPKMASKSLFGELPQNSVTAASNFSIPPPSSSQSTASLATATPPTTQSTFGTLGGQKAISGVSAPTSNASSHSLFPSLGKPQNSASTLGSQAAVTGSLGGQPTLLTPTTKSSLFGSTGQSTAPSAMAQSAAQFSNQGSTTAAPEKAVNIPSLGNSTTGSAPPAQSRLKNKSMDEIITRWATDLSKYQKEFQTQAEKVSYWDQMLVENSEKIQKLYGNTLGAERAMTEVERQLTAVENDQEELSTWLDHYEKEVNQMMSSQVGHGESLQGPDQEREKT